MNLGIWKEELVPDLDTALARAQAGAAYLDKKFGPVWAHYIDLDRLNVASPFNCVLAQINRKYRFCQPGLLRKVVDCGFSTGLFTECFGLIFRIPAVVRSYRLLTEAWRILLRQRRQAWVAARPAVCQPPQTVVRSEERLDASAERKTGMAV